MPYSTFSLRGDTQGAAISEVGQLSLAEARGLIGPMTMKSSTVLELAATIHWLVYTEKVSDWETELVRRKGVRTERGRMKEAIELLGKLALSPA
jgi:hypothetical protein